MPTVNGREFQHGTIDLQIISTGGAVQIGKFKKLAYKTAAEKKAVNAADGRVVGYTIDNTKNDGTLALLLSEWLAFKAGVLAQNPGLGIGQIEFDVSVTYGNTLASLQTDKLGMVMFNSEGRDSADNQDALAVEIPLFIGTMDLAGGAFIQY